MRTRSQIRKNSFKSKKESKDQESIQSSTTPDPGYQWESDNITIRHYKPMLAYKALPEVWILVWAFIHINTLYILAAKF